MIRFRDFRERRIALIALGLGVVFGVILMRGYTASNLRLWSRLTTYLEYLPPRGQIECTQLTPSPIGRFESATVVIDDLVYAFGGFDSYAYMPGRLLLGATTRVDVYDPQQDTWRRLSDMPTPVTHAGVAVHDGIVWVAGGFVGNHPGKATDAVWKYDTATDRWEPGPSLPEPRASAPLVRSGETLHYFGGLLPDRCTSTGDHWAIALPEGESWEPRAPLPDARNHMGGAELGGLIYAIGGQHDHDCDGLEDVSSVHAYDPELDTWKELAPLPYGRSHFEPGTFVMDGHIVIAGGRSNELAALYDITAYDPGTNQWRDVAPLYAALRAPTMARIGERVFSGFGGIAPSGLGPQSEWRACDAAEFRL